MVLTLTTVSIFKKARTILSLDFQAPTLECLIQDTLTVGARDVNIVPISFLASLTRSLVLPDTISGESYDSHHLFGVGLLGVTSQISLEIDTVSFESTHFVSPVRILILVKARTTNRHSDTSTMLSLTAVLPG
jgi:hypothetical protein